MHYELGLIAENIKNSVSPRVYEYYAGKLGFTVSYNIYNIAQDKLRDTLASCRETLRGFNITMPYKKTALEYMDELDESAKSCGSVNTVLVRNGKLVAYNTDGWGAVNALEKYGARLHNAHVVMLGAGGVAVAIAYNLKQAGVKSVDIVNGTYRNASALCERFGERFTPYPYEGDVLSSLCRGADVFINASAIGYIGKEDFTDLSFLSSMPQGAFVLDVNYTNPDALLVPMAQALGLNAHNGRCMTACQGIRATEIWTGMRPDDASVFELISDMNKQI